MAKLPKYERTNRLMVDSPQLSTPQFGEQIKTASKIKNALDKVSAFAEEEAGKYVVKKAIEYSVDNPVTLEQLQAAKESGINPIEQALNGGMVWNEAMQKLYAKQASNELLVEMYNHYDNTLDKVNKGELTDQALIKQELETPLKAWRDIISQIDLEEANAFYQKGIVSGGSVYKQSLRKVRSIEQDRQDKINEGVKLGIRKDWELFIANNPNDVELIMVEYNNALAKATSLFEGSSRKQSYIDEIKKNYSDVLTAHMADSFVSEFNSVEEALLAVDSNKVTEAWSPVWKEFTEPQRDHVRRLVVRGFSQASSRQSGKMVKFDAEAKNTIKMIIGGDDRETISEKINNLQIAVDEEVHQTTKESMIRELRVVQAYQSMSKDLDGHSKVDQEMIVSKLPPPAKEIGEAILKGWSSAEGTDPVAFHVRRDPKATLGNVKLALVSPEEFNNSMEPQLTVQDQDKIFKNANQVFTKNQADYFQRVLAEGNNKEIVMMANSFANNKSKIHSERMFNQIAKGSPWFAVVGRLTMSEGNKETVARILEGKSLLGEGYDVNTGPFRGSEAWQMMREAYPYHEGDVPGISQAAVYHFVGTMGTNKKFDFTDKIDLVAHNEKLTNSLQTIVGRNVRADGDYGGIVSINGRSVILHEDIKADAAEDYIQKASLNDFINATSGIGGVGNHSLNDLRDSLLVRYGDEYQLVDVNGSELQLPNGQPIKIDLHALQDSFNFQSMVGGVSDPMFHMKQTYGRKAETPGWDSKREQWWQERQERIEEEKSSGKDYGLSK